MCRHEPLPDAHALVRLPWFEHRDGRLALAARDLGPIVDAHTHLALAFLLPHRVDLEAAPAPTAHYLPLDRRLDLDVYVNRNFNEEDLRRLKRDLTLGSLTASGMRATHTAPNLVREMDEMGVAASLLLPIDFPVLSWNAEAYLEVSSRRRELPALGSVHPFAPGALGKLRVQKAAGARGIKFHPAVQLVAPDAERAIELFHEAGTLGLPVLAHSGPVGIEARIGRTLSQVRRFERPIRECPHTTFVLGHAGALQMEEALALARRHENVCLELSSQSLSNVRRILDEGPPERIVFGSDWPFYHQAIPLAKVLLSTEERPALRRKVLFENAARIFGLQLAQ
jgi:predicted TIM-barrel fold metal-dependent hydrolase